jgi:hypothetical protein
VGRINRGDGDGGDPARSPSGHASFRWPNRSKWRASQEFAEAGTPAFLYHLIGIPYRSTDGHWGCLASLRRLRPCGSSSFQIQEQSALLK